MAVKVTSIFINGGTSDVHLLKGSSYDLGNKLALSKTDGTNPWAVLPADSAALKITFTSNFKGTLAADEFSGNGIKIHIKKGIITADAGAVAHPRQNFIVVIEASGTDVLNGPHRLYVRFHIHTDIVHQWLTPSPLTVRRGMMDPAHPEITGMKFSVYAQFDDGLMGDLTNYCSFQNPSDANSIKWTPATHIDKQFDGKIIVPAGAAVGSEVEITATFPASLKSKVSKAKIKIAEEWIAGKKNKVQLLPNSAGYDKRNEVPNVLFLTEGFVTGDELAFETTLVKIITKMKNEAIFQPFSLLLSSMNFWYSFTRSESRGVTNENEYYDNSADPAKPDYWVVQPPEIPQGIPIFTVDVINKWTLHDIIFYIGFPSANQQDATLKNDWYETIMLDTNDVTNKALLDAVYANTTVKDGWLRLKTRRLIDKKDTFFGVTIGYTPDANRGSNSFQSTFDLKSNRLDRNKLNPFLATLVDPQDRSLKDLWNLNADGINGKDFDLIVILTNSLYGRAVNGDGFFFICAQEKNTDIDHISMQRSLANPVPINQWFEVTPAPLSELPPANCRTLIHELAHSFALEDEYGENISGSTEDVRKPNFYYKFPPLINGIPNPDYTNYLAISPNLQSESDVTSLAGDLDGDRIKWRWPRIEKAGVVNGPIVDKGGGKFEIPLRPNIPFFFFKDDIVFLRLRLESGFKSDAFEVVSFSGITHEMEIKPLGGSFLPPDLVLMFQFDSLIKSAVDAKKESKVSKVTTILNGNFHIELRPGHQAYIPNEKIHLVLTNNSPLQHPDQVSISRALKIVDNQTGDLVTVVAESGTVALIDVKRFLKGSVLYKPMDALPSVKTATYKYSEIIAKNVLDAIKSLKKPLTKDPAVYDRSLPQTVEPNLITAIKYPAGWCSGKKNMVVGLFSGGKLFHTGIYHPAGHCMMRGSTDDMAEFCPVCKYILTDMIDPSQHGATDFLIGPLYPIRS